jgi:phenylacetate-CoA ligase
LSEGRDREPLLTRARWSAHIALHAPLQGRFQFRPPAAIERTQRRRLRETVDHAYRYVPYYRETMDGLGLRPADLRTAADLAQLPVIEREQLQRDPDRFVSRARPADSYIELHSGGTSGEPLTIRHHPFALFAAASYRERFRATVLDQIGWRLRLRELSVASPLSTGRGTRSAFDSRSLIPTRLRTVRQRASMLDSLDAVVDRINEFRPHTLGSYGSYLEALFLHLHRTGRPFHRPLAVLYGADALSDQVRQLITETYGIRVLSTYGAIEAFHIGFECGHHTGYHLNTDLYPVRIVDGNGTELPDGASGEVAVSNLVNRGTVLLNYRLGDLASKVPSECPCGRNMPLLSYLEGRADDWLESVSGERIHPQAARSLFTPETEVWRYQVRQRHPSAFDVVAVVADGCDREALRTRLVRGFVERFGEDATIDIAFVESLPRTAGGKVRRVVSAQASARSGATAE